MQVEALIKENNAIDIYYDYFSGELPDHSSEQPLARTITILRDPSPLKRSASYISWLPDGASRSLLLALACCADSRAPRRGAQGGGGVLAHQLPAAAGGDVLQQLRVGREQPEHARL